MKKTITLQKIIYGLFFLILIVATIFVSINKKSYSKWNLDADRIEFRFPPLEATISISETETLKKRLAESKDPNELSSLQAQLANVYVSTAKKTGQTELYSEAETLAISSLSLVSENPQATMALVKVLSARHEFGKALELLNSVNLNTKSSGDIIYLRALTFLALGRFDEAFTDAIALANQSPSLSTATLKALVYNHLGLDDLAFHYFSKALELEDIGEDAQAVLTRGQFAVFLIKKGNYTDAIRLTDAALKVIPNSAYVKLVKAQALNAQKKYVEAYALLTRAFADSKEPIYLLNMVFSLKLQKKSEDFNVLAQESIDIYKKEIKENLYGHLLDLASLYYVTENYKECIKTVLLDQQNRRNLRGDLLLAKSYIKQSKISDARDVLEKQIATGTTEVALYYLIKTILNEKTELSLIQLYDLKAEQNNPNYNMDLLFTLP